MLVVPTNIVVVCEDRVVVERLSTGTGFGADQTHQQRGVATLRCCSEILQVWDDVIRKVRSGRLGPNDEWRTECLQGQIAITRKGRIAIGYQPFLIL